VLFEDRDPAVPLQFDREIGGRRLDAGQRGAQRPAQQLGETDAECGGRGAGEAVAHVGGEHDRGLAQSAHRGQQVGRLERGGPVAEIVECVGGVELQCFGVLGVRRGRRCERVATEGRGQVVQQDQPGHRVDGEVVHGDHEGAGGFQPGEGDDVSGLGVELCRGLVRHGRGVGGVRSYDGDLVGRFGAQGPHAVLDAQAQSQGRVGGDHGVRGALGVGEGGAFGSLEGPGLGESGEGAAQFALAQDDGGGGEGAVLAAGGGGGGCLRCARRQVVGQCAGGLEQEDLPG
jgi:hypothetical protein